MYADNLVLVSASVNLLQKMIDICCEEAVYLDMKFNALKSNIICTGPRCSDISIELFVDSTAIPCVNRVKYARICLVSARSFKVCWQQPKKKFFIAVNGRAGSVWIFRIQFDLVHFQSQVPSSFFSVSVFAHHHNEGACSG